MNFIDNHVRGIGESTSFIKLPSRWIGFLHINDHPTFAVNPDSLSINIRTFFQPPQIIPNLNSIKQVFQIFLYFKNPCTILVRLHLKFSDNSPSKSFTIQPKENSFCGRRPYSDKRFFGYPLNAKISPFINREIYKIIILKYPIPHQSKSILSE